MSGPTKNLRREHRQHSYRNAPLRDHLAGSRDPRPRIDSPPLAAESSPIADNPAPPAQQPLTTFRSFRSSTMYDMYPDWGPSRHNPDHQTDQAVQYGLDLRDNGGQ